MRVIKKSIENNIPYVKTITMEWRTLERGVPCKVEFGGDGSVEVRAFRPVLNFASIFHLSFKAPKAAVS
jgi:hypothetical protein